MAQFSSLILIFLFSFLLVVATDILIINLRSLSQKSRLKKWAIIGLILGLTTSLPEFFVALSAALAGKPILALGNIIGANIANLSLVVGGAALIGGTVMVKGTFLRRDVFYAFLAATSPMLLLSDKILTRIDGLILVILYVFYKIIIFTGQPNQEEKPLRLLRKFNYPFRQVSVQLAWILGGLALLIFAADALVKVASQFALAFNFPLLLVGLLLISLGTTLPELIFAIEPFRQRKTSLIFDNLLGSIVANGTLIIGLAALISPIRIQNFNSYLLSTMAFLLIFGLFYFFIHTKHRLERWEGGFLLIVFLIFMMVIMRSL